MDFSQDGEDFRFAPLGAALHCADEEGELPKVTVDVISVGPTWQHWAPSPPLPTRGGDLTRPDEAEAGR
jgi:hypothetical protein